MKEVRGDQSHPKDKSGWEKSPLIYPKVDNSKSQTSRHNNNNNSVLILDGFAFAAGKNKPQKKKSNHSYFPTFHFFNQILCDLHFADMALMESSDFMQQLRNFKPQSLGCAVARRKSSTTLIFPLPPQACSGKQKGGEKALLDEYEFRRRSCQKCRQ